MELHLTEKLNILGIESSCDDTAAAVICGLAGGPAEILSSIVVGQTELHATFGGVVPEIAARAHVEKLDVSVVHALEKAGLGIDQIDAIAVTAGPGLIGGVVSGVMLAKGLAAATGKPLFGVNHLAGHALTPRLTDNVSFPYLMLLVSGGHCQFLIAQDAQTFRRLGGTIDDAPGEAFDKVARLIGLEQPGGPKIEECAVKGDPKRFKLPRPLLDREGCDMSFSGLKTAALRARDEVIVTGSGLTQQDQADLAAGFQAAVSDVLAEKSRRALREYLKLSPDYPTLCVAGGVAANMEIRSALKQVCAELDVEFIAPPLALCTDNAAMIAYAGLAQMPNRAPDTMDLSAKPRMPLDTSSPTMLGHGKKGAKA
jgi:N6-L-threonylcarbamoyladenine synthase